MSLYNEIIMTYAKSPTNMFKMEDYTFRHLEESRVCGDTVEVFLKTKDNIIEDFSFVGNTSIITKACASIFGESIIGKSSLEILDLDFGYIKNLVGEISPRRKYGATLGLLATRNAIHEFLGDSKVDDFSDVLKSV